MSYDHKICKKWNGKMKSCDGYFTSIIDKIGLQIIFPYCLLFRPPTIKTMQKLPCITLHPNLPTHLQFLDVESSCHEL